MFLLVFYAALAAYVSQEVAVVKTKFNLSRYASSPLQVNPLCRNLLSESAKIRISTRVRTRGAVFDSDEEEM